jgi:hypothetical protein
MVVGPSTFTNQGSVQASGGGFLYVQASTWVDAGAIVVTTGGTVNLANSFTLTPQASFSGSGGTINLTGTLDLQGGTLDLSISTNSWQVLGGTLKNGTYVAGSSAALVFTNSGGTLDNITANSDLDLSQGQGVFANVLNNLTLHNATIRLGGDGAVNTLRSAVQAHSRCDAVSGRSQGRNAM